MGRARDAEARSRALAEAAVQRLVVLEVEPHRVVAVGLGAHCPIDPRRTREATAHNNRIVWTTVRLSVIGRTNLRVGCARARHLVPATVGPPRSPPQGPS